MMKSMIVLASLLFTAGAFAASVNFTYFGNENGRESFYACDYAEGQTEMVLELLGATDIDVRCSGGIQSGGWSMQPVSVRAKYELPEVTGTGVETVILKGDTWNPACGLNVRIIKEVLKTFTNVEVVKKSDSCAFATTNYYYKLNVAQ